MQNYEDLSTEIKIQWSTPVNFDQINKQNTSNALISHRNFYLAVPIQFQTIKNL